MNRNDKSVEELFIKYGLEFQEQIPEKCRKLNKLANELNNSDIQYRNIRELYRLTHNLTGSAMTFGIEEVAEKSMALSKYIYPLTQKLVSQNMAVVKTDIEIIEYYLFELNLTVKNLPVCINAKPEVPAYGS